MAGKIRGLLFDKDGTLFDFDATWTDWAEIALGSVADGDSALVDRLADRIGFERDSQTYRRDSVAIAGTVREIAEAMSPELPHLTIDDIVTSLSAAAETAPLTEAVPLRPLMTRFREAGLALGVATNDAEIPALSHLDSANIRDCFDFVSGYDSGHGTKPAPGPCLAFAKHMGVAPESVAMVGDSTHDLQAGRAAGMVTIGVLTGPASAEELAPHADMVFENIGALPGWLGIA